MKYFLLLLLIFNQQLHAQEINIADKKNLEDIKRTIDYLADDKLEGRRTGTKGEKLAYQFIQDQFQKTALLPGGDNKTFLQEFEVNDGREIKTETAVAVNNRLLVRDSGYFPFAFSANVIAQRFRNAEDTSIRYYDIGNLLTGNKINPHFDLKENIYATAMNAVNDHKQLFIVYNSSQIKDELVFDKKDKHDRLKIPVIYITDKSTFKNDVEVTISISQKIRYGHNVIGLIDNHASATIILGAHYDHLGYGEDHNSLYTGSTPMIHNGADDNASGVAALIVLSKWLKSAVSTKYNFVFVAFSGEELGLYGSKYFTDHSPVDLKTVNYMLNMDMIGRLNDSTHGLTIGGYGTSPAWGKIIQNEKGYFKIKTDSSGTGPSDHTSFYNKDIPVLFFFTGAHSDYHKPSDDADKINYNGEIQVIGFIERLITTTNGMEKLSFAKTRDNVIGRTSFKVTLGIMPDYTFDGNGVRVDGISEGRPAQKAGIKIGDILYQLGEHTFNGMEEYMHVLNTFNKGDATKIKLKRGKDDIELDVVF